MRNILITINDIKLKATLLDTDTADLIYEALPLEGNANLWGDEIYFHVPLACGEESDAREEVEVGDLAFWPVGSAFCIFFGKTPVSIDDKPRAYSPVNIFGKLEGDFEALKTVQSQSLIRVTKNQESE